MENVNDVNGVIDKERGRYPPQYSDQKNHNPTSIPGKSAVDQGSRKGPE
jgi:hypothetical protein